MEVDKVAMHCSGAWVVSQFGIFAVWISGGRPALVYHAQRKAGARRWPGNGPGRNRLVILGLR
jgi:hypothetical protein